MDTEQWIYVSVVNGGETYDGTAKFTIEHELGGLGALDTRGSV